jgi:hypothetical protein
MIGMLLSTLTYTCNDVLSFLDCPNSGNACMQIMGNDVHKSISLVENKSFMETLNTVY